MNRLETMARTKAGMTGPLATLGRMAALAIVVFAGVAVAASFLGPGLALAVTLSSSATGARPEIVDGGSEIAGSMSWRIEIMVEYIAIGLATVAIALRFGRDLLAKLQDWYEGLPMTPARPLRPAAVVVTPQAGRDRACAPANDRKRELHAH